VVPNPGNWVGLNGGNRAISIMVITFIVLACVGLIGLERLRKPVLKSEIQWIQYGLTFRAAGLLFLATPLYVVITSLLAGRRTQALILGSAFTLFGAPMFLLAFRWKVGYDANGIHCRSAWRRKRFIPWADVTGVRFVDSMKQWVIETRSQGTVRINEFVPGVQYLIAELKQRGISGIPERPIPAPY